ncbi:MAG: hypothetical protein HY746_10595 [Elusimicrobia bacterium]|nr:hypothetical protein [Elusimicrobiota bacterium]
MEDQAQKIDFRWVILYCVTFAAVAAAVYNSIKSKRRILTHLSSFLNGSVSGFLNPGLSGKIEKAGFTIEIKKANNRPVLKIIFQTALSFRLKMQSRKSFGDNESFFPLKQITAGDADYDREYAVFADDGTAAAIFLSDPSIRNSANALFQAGVRNLEIRRNAVELEKVCVDEEFELEENNFRKFLNHLLNFSKMGAKL